MVERRPNRFADLFKVSVDLDLPNLAILNRLDISNSAFSGPTSPLAKLGKARGRTSCPRLRGSLQAGESSDFLKCIHRTPKLSLHQMRWRPKWLAALCQKIGRSLKVD